ncbi:GNAT family N-acetyltransferase [Haliscomenobacter sp.]|uniref:GNAT family N-acetyltransferase n=1 Tax=Haliscomenobacter sp. TaxID=2717303 RepID=UPI003BAC50C4
MVNLRTIYQEDLPRLFEIYASTRAEELALVPDWPEEQKMAFLSQQFVAQHQYYQEFYQGAELQVIELDQEVVGRLYVHWSYSPQEVRIMDVALLPAYRGQGIGSQLIKAVQKKGAEMGKTVTIHVEYNNPALQLYQRLGFQKIGEFNSVYYLLEWKPVA